MIGATPLAVQARRANVGGRAKGGVMRLSCLGCVLLVSLAPMPAAATCNRFSGSTMESGGLPRAQWRTDHPSSADGASAPWQSINFRTEPHKYMLSVLDSAKPHFSRSGRKLVGTGSEPWWMSLWLDYTSSGREPHMGLTK